uniref:Uncharacterized protein n=1 Tax=Tetradesmus obliquus TaxID=3088 RepID=A0A383VWF0_TETOB|eukprot:jgi/Sobl393_1/9412/SZX69094.1
MSSLVNFFVALAVLTSGLLLAPANAYPEYIAELPTHPKHARGVGHVSAEGGGLRNKFGQDFAAAGHTWTKELCQADSDGDGYSNGEELGDPNCTWKKGQPLPASSGSSISHPGLKSSVPRPLPKASSAAAAAAAATATAAAVGSASEAWVGEPSADMPVPQGSERNMQGHQPQRWCDARDKAEHSSSSSSSSSSDAGDALPGRDRQWLNFTLLEMTVLGAPDLYSCHPYVIPDSVPDEREFVGVRVGLDGASHLHHILLMECPGDLWFLKDITRNSEMCTTHSGSMFSACNRWWIATEANNDYRMCTPPGLIYAKAGEMRRNNKVLVLQVHWVFGSKLQNHSVTLANASLELQHEAPPPERDSQIMETIEGTAIYPPSVMQHVNGLVIPGGEAAYTSSYKCGRRCTYVPLGRLSPQPVTIAGYTFHGHHFMTGMRMSIKRCPLTRLPDVSWEVRDWQQSVVHPTYDITGEPVQLWPGDELSWSCTFNTSTTNRTVLGGYAGYSEEMCIMLLHYYPRNALLRGCSALTAQQGGHSICMYEAASILGFMNSEASRVPIRTVLSPRSVPPFDGASPNLYSGYKASIVLFWALLLTAFLWSVSALLGRCKRLGLLHTAYCALSPQNKRNMVVYIMHLLFDTVLFMLWIEPVFGGFCGCTEAGPSHGWLLGVILVYIVVAYLIELVWRARIDVMLALHHVVTILIIAVMFGEASAEIYVIGDPLIVLALFAVLEQPTFVALLLKRVLPVGSVHITRAWVVAVWSWFASKTISLVLATWFIARDWHMMPHWVRGTYISLWAFIYSIQIWSGCIQLSILKTVRREQQGQVRLLPAAPASSKAGNTAHEDECLMAASSSDGSLSEHGLGLKDCEVCVDDAPAAGGVKKLC